MKNRPAELVKGTLDLLVLKTLDSEGGPLHGWSVSKRIRQDSNEVLQVTQGSLYPALHRMEARGWISAEWRTSELGRRAKFYKLTRPGRARLRRETEAWCVFARSMERILAAEV